MPRYLDFELNDLFGPHYEIPLSLISSLELVNPDNFKNRLALLFNMIQEMNSAKDEAELFDLAIGYAGKILHVDRASIGIVDEENDTLTLTALYGVDADCPKDIVIPLKTTATGHSYLRDNVSYRPSLIESTCPMIKSLNGAGLNSTMVAPIVCGDKRYGTLNSANVQADGYDNDDIHLFAQITATLATHLHNIRLQKTAKEQNEILMSKNRELEALSYVDPLTKAYNRRYINKILSHELLQMNRNPRELSVIIMDIDFFKEVNDRLGHLAGDAVLLELSSLIKSSIRENDIFVRWGGEEFLIVSLNTNVVDTYALAEKLRVLVDKASSDVLEGITLSFGVSAYVDNDSIDSFIQRADKALYISKDNGRNMSTLL